MTFTKSPKKSYLLANPLFVEGVERVHLRVEVDYDKLQFFHSSEGVNWSPIGGLYDASVLSDEYMEDWGGFIGAFVGLCCQDGQDRTKYADFDYYEYVEK